MILENFDDLKNITVLDKVIEEIALSSNLKDSYLESQIKSNWSKLIGEVPSKHIKISRLKEKVLYLYTQSSTWRTEIRLRENKIKEDINKLLNECEINSIIVR